MPLINEFHDSLPYIDQTPSEQARANAEKLIGAELPSDYRSTLHPAIPAMPEIRISPMMQQELERKGKSLPIIGGIDLSRYEAPEPPDSASESTKQPNEVLGEWRETLRRAYIASSHLSVRQENLSLLESHGKNAWLIGNAQLEEVLRQFEKELRETTDVTEALHRERKMRQEMARGELEGLQDSWKRGISGAIDAELAAEGVRREILEKRREQSASCPR